MKIEWAPVRVPPRRRLQTFAAGVYATIVFGWTFAAYITVGALIIFGGFTWKILCLSYIFYIYYGHKTNFSAVNSIGFKWLRENFLWKSFRDYFPIELVKTAELPPNRNYILGCFPHGIIGTSVSTNMCLDISRWLELFPQVRPKVGTLDVHFCTPFLREFLRFSGMISVEKQSLVNHLRMSNNPKDPINTDGFTSNAVAILVGGAREALDARPRNYVLTLKHRKGFIKLALETGCPLVPVFSFGEVDMFDQVDNPPNSFLRNLQIFTKKWTGIAPVVIVGRGFFQYTFGFLPHRRHVVQVVGAPIEVTQCTNPSNEQIDELHKKFVKALSDLFETHKSKYIENSTDLKLVVQ